MAILVSPGVDVSVIDESFYGSAGPGTVPLIVIATANNKAGPSGVGIAPQTMPAKAGSVFTATSQRELVQNFGNPHFYNIQGTPLHGHELNEYGLLSAYQYLGISNRAYIIRADIDLAQLEASDTAPRGAALAGTYWLETDETSWGVFKSNGNALPGVAWESQKAKVVLAGDAVDSNGTMVPRSGFGVNGDFAVVAAQTDNRIYEKIAGAWVEIGTTSWKAAKPTKVTGSTSPTNATQGHTFTINGSTITVGVTGTAAGVASTINTATITDITAAVVSGALVITNTAGGNIVIANGSGTALTALGLTVGTKVGVSVSRTNSAQYPAASVAGDVWVKGTTPNKGADWKVRFYNIGMEQWVNMTAPFYPYDSTLVDGNATKDLEAFDALGVPATGTVYVGFDAAEGVQVLRRWSGARWEDLVYEAGNVAPYTAPEDGTYWFNADFRVDMMVGDGTKWMGYRRKYPTTDPAGVILAGSRPYVQSDGTPLVDNDLWIDTTDLEHYPALYRYNTDTMRWKRVDNTDQTTPFGIVFSDARANSGVEFEGMANDGEYTYESEEMEDMLVSDYLDPDAPDPRSHPDGTLLFNSRYSTYNVKVWRPDYFKDGNFDTNTDYTADTYTVGSPAYEFPALADSGRWVTASANRHDGAPYMGRHAQRIMVVRAMASALLQNEEVRSELIYFNLMAAPGYPELMDEMVMLNTDQKEYAFIVGDTPARLSPAAFAMESWAKNMALAPSNGDEGLVTSNVYTGVYYPWGLTTNLDGIEVMVPPSTMVLRTMAYNDQVAYPWFAPAGFQRGLVTNATMVGYLTKENEFKSVLLNQGQRDVMYLNKINPIAFIPGRGLVVYGQKTLSPVESAMDRVNVARLANYLKYTLDLLLRPYLFEQNDEYTRTSVKLTMERFLSNLMSLRALYDFAVLCDISNNTPERIDRNELWVDVLIKPEKSIEFIYVPVRIQNTGAVLPQSGV